MACVAWAFLDEKFSAGEFANPEGSDLLRNQLLGTAGAEDEALAEMVQKMNPDGTAARPMDLRPTQNDTVDDLAEIRALMAGGPPEVQGGD